MTDAERSYMADLANHLGDLFHDLSSIALLAEEAGLDQEKIPYQAIPVDYWRRVLQEAIKSGRGITPVIQVALGRYPNNKKLVELFTQMPTPDPGAMVAGIEKISEQIADLKIEVTDLKTEQKSQYRRTEVIDKKLSALALQVSGISQQVAGLNAQMVNQ